METNLEEYNLTQDDIENAEQKIVAFDLTKKDKILYDLSKKLEILMSSKMNSIKANLINDIYKLFSIIRTYKGLDENVTKSILFAFEYFVKKDDEIPDEIPELGYLDDMVLVRYVVNKIKTENAQLFQA